MRQPHKQHFLLFVRCVRSTPQPGGYHNRVNNQDWIHEAPVFLLLFAVLWLHLCVIWSLAGGWYKLARLFRAQQVFKGRKWPFQGAVMRWTRAYRVTVGANRAGLHIACFLFRILHPPLFIPWEEISIGRNREWVFGGQVCLMLGREAQVQFVIPASLANKLRAEAGAQWPVESVL